MNYDDLKTELNTGPHNCSERRSLCWNDLTCLMKTVVRPDTPTFPADMIIFQAHHDKIILGQTTVQDLLDRLTKLEIHVASLEQEIECLRPQSIF